MLKDKIFSISIISNYCVELKNGLLLEKREEGREKREERRGEAKLFFIKVYFGC